ncbi:MAG: phospho-sugar mutase [Parachlamydiales bacterium]
MKTESIERQIGAWLEGDYDLDTKAEIQRLQRENPEALVDAFYTDLKFGTAGLRGIMGVGSNRMNVYTVRRATLGLARYLENQKAPGPVLIAYDSRHNSRRFAEETARVLAACNREALLYREIRPVPLASFGCRYQHCAAAVMITASHNPPEYNGYKVYWSHGGQVLPPDDSGIIEEVERIKALDKIKTVPLNHPLIHQIDGEVDAAYLSAIVDCQSYPEQNQKEGGKLALTYTSLHGTGITLMPEALKRWGFSNLSLVEKQCLPDGDFPTTKSPNPEEEEALSLGIEQLRKAGGDLLIATDPDADRLGAAILHEGEPVIFTGNQIACLCLDHLCQAAAKTGSLPKTTTFIKTIVTTELFRTIAIASGFRCIDLLPGFKYIGQMMERWALAPPGGPTFGFAAEESYGYLVGTHTRDKDAIVCGCLLAEAALAAKLRGETLLDQLHRLYHQYGIHREHLKSLTYKGKEGQQEIKGMMEHLRASPPTEIEGIPIMAIEDYLSGKRREPATGTQKPLPLPKTDALLFWLEDGTKLVVRPSGTEPKIKIYCGIVSSRFPTLQKGIADADARAERYLTRLEAHLR